MQSVPTSRVLMVVALIMVISSPATSQPLNQQLQPLLQQQQQRTGSIALLPQEWRKRAVEDLLSQLSSQGGDAAELVARATGEGEAVSMVTEVEGGVAKGNLERSVDSPRERKAGCKNFYWKGFTSC